MKTVALRNAKQRLSEVCRDAQKERITITRHGRPSVVLIGVDGMDLEEVVKVATDAVASVGGKKKR